MCPRGVDQTLRSTQSWHTLAPSLRQKSVGPPTVRGPGSRNQKHHYSGLDAWTKLARPPPKRNPHTNTLKKPHQRRLVPANRVFNLSQLERLPNELLTMIFAAAGGKKDVLALGLASSVLWEHAVRFVTLDCLRHAAPWAGKEVARTWFRSAVDAFEACDGDVWSEWGEALDAHAESIGGLPREMLRESLVEASTLFPAWALERKWVLRNLSTNEFVSIFFDDGDDLLGPYAHHAIVAYGAQCVHGKLALDDVLMMRTCWTSPKYSSARFTNDVWQGKWVGHCFGIVLREEMSEEEGWKDATSEILAEGEALLPVMAKWAKTSRRVKKASNLGLTEAIKKAEASTKVEVPC